MPCFFLTFGRGRENREAAGSHHSHSQTQDCTESGQSLGTDSPGLQYNPSCCKVTAFCSEWILTRWRRKEIIRSSILIIIVLLATPSPLDKTNLDLLTPELFAAPQHHPCKAERRHRVGAIIPMLLQDAPPLIHPRNALQLLLTGYTASWCRGAG